MSASESASAFEPPVPWADAPDAAPLDRRARRSRLTVVPSDPPTPEPPAESAPAGAAAVPAESAVPGAHDGALFDWARQIPEWRSAAPAPAARRRPPQAAPRLRTSAAPRSAALELWHDRLTRRGRVVALTVATVLATGVLAGLFVAVATGGASASGAPTESALTEAPSTVVVRDGDTLWEIAQRVRPGDDPRSTVHEIVRVNSLSESELEPGQELVMPDF
ncbi:LysM peptidoglycan-binding domain-containing protein [Streptomonospora litoralis]|uniref:LysM peptidoglycan-binding domain-containing protein n=1 Tax=Streptomonospora litoralis TaxID=2498135 RepID=UPI001A954A59|nr:LysM peptidoglycan-binding domain-containing protein [Streptomonospora litoralis]